MTATNYLLLVQTKVSLWICVFDVERVRHRKMTENAEHLSVVMTTKPVVNGSDVTSSWSHVIGFHIQWVVIVIGVVGTAANALILYALVASKQHKKHVLIANQNALDLLSCLFMVITYAVKLCNFQLIGWPGYLLCIFILDYNLLWCFTIGSIINLPIITIERYLKVVHPIRSRNKLRNWMIHSAAAFSWIFGFVYINILSITTSAVVDGVCYVQQFNTSHLAMMAHAIWHFISFYVVVVFIFIFCYWRILAAIRRKAKVMTGPGAAASSTTQTQAQAKSLQIQSNVIKTMILVSAFYAIAWAPIDVYYLLVNVGTNLTLDGSGFYSVQFISWLFMCGNPFIYAIKFDPVKRILISLVPCKKTSEQPIECIEIGNSSAATRARQERN